MQRKPIPELAPDAPELQRHDDGDIPVELPDPARPETMPVAELSNLAGPRGQLVDPAQRAAAAALYSQAAELVTNKYMPLQDCPTNLDMRTARGKALALAAANPGDVEMGPDKVVRIKATHYLIFPQATEDEETGERRVFARTVLFDREGRTFRTTAQHAPHRVAAMLSLYSAKEWAAGIPLIIRARPSKRKGRADWHDIRIDMEQLPAGG